MEAWVTLVTNDSYSQGALTLAASLRGAGTSRRLAVMVGGALSTYVRAALEEAFDEVVDVDPLDSGDTPHLALLERADLGVTFTKIRCWTLTQFSKAVFLDADTLVLHNCDELFDREEFSAAPDAGWPDCFNSGVFVFRPNLDTYRQLLEHAATAGSFDGGDQGLLNTFFSSWATKDIANHLPFVYNVVSSAVYSYRPAFKRFSQDVKIVHFVGAVKPWDAGEPRPGAGEPGLGDDNGRKAWWDLYSLQVVPLLARHRADGAFGFGGRVSPANRSAQQAATPSFDTILAKINDTMSK